MSRTAIQDANAGTTRIAEKEATRASLRVTSPGISTEKGQLERAIPVAEATTQALQTVNNLYQTQAQAGAAMRQGTEEGVNAVDAANKRGEFMSFLFGQDAGYSTAVGIATKNFANNEYIRQMDSVNKHLDKTPEEYQAIVGKEVEAIINEKYADDSMAKQIAMNEWQTQSRKLAREHAAKHMVYAQEQAHVASVQDLTAQFDDIHMNMRPGMTQEAQTEALAQMQEILRPDFQYVAEDGSVATKVASKNIQVRAVADQLRVGNHAILKALPKDFTKGMNVPQLRMLDRAKDIFDRVKASDGEIIVEAGLMAATKNDPAGLADAMQQLSQHEAVLSGSVYSKLMWDKQKRRLETAYQKMQKNVAKDAVATKDYMAYYNAREEGDAGGAGEHYSKKNQERADDVVVMVAATNAARAAGLPDFQSEGEAINYALSSPVAIESIALRAERFGSISKGFAEGVKQRVMNIVPDENGYISEEDLVDIDNLRTLYRKAPAQMRKALGPDASAMIEITMANSHESVKEIQDKRSNYIKNKGMTLTKGQLGIPSDETMEDWIQSRTKDTLDPAALVYYKEQLQTGYQIYGGDTRAAEKYMLEQYNLNNTNWRGKNVKNAGIIQEQVDVPEVLDMLEGSGMAEALIGTRIPFMEDGNPIRGFNDLSDVQFEVNPGTKELYIQSSQFSFPIVIQATELQNIAIKAQEQKDAMRKQEEEAFKARMSVIGQSGQMWPTPQE